MAPRTLQQIDDLVQQISGTTRKQMLFGILTYELLQTELECCVGLFPRLFFLEAPVLLLHQMSPGVPAAPFQSLLSQPKTQ